MKRYTWKPPKIIEGSWVRFYDHRGKDHIGECLRATTRYDRIGVAYHIYEMWVKGQRRRFYVREGQIIGSAMAMTAEAR